MNNNDSDQNLISRGNSLISDGFWVVLFQVIGAAGQLVGIRILTEVLPEDIFGTFFLWYGAVALVATAVANPTMQALLRFYPEYYFDGKGILPRVAARRQILKLSLWTLPVIVVGTVVFFLRGGEREWIVPLLIALAMTEIARTQSLVLLNATRAQRAYGAWVALEAWSRPLLAGALVLYFDASVELVLLAYLTATLIVLLPMRRLVPKDDKNVGEPPNDLVSRFWKYSLPILPLGVLGWVSGVADRYIIGGLLTVADVGAYVAVYSIVSRAYLLAGGVIELVMRPVYYQVLRTGDDIYAARIERRWLLMLALVCISGVLVTSGFHKLMSLLLVGRQYRTYSYLMPVIAAGYSMLLLSNFYSRVCYARDRTRSVLHIELIGASASIALAFLFISIWGIIGAAAAAPCYFGLQAFTARYFAKATTDQSFIANDAADY